MADPFSAAAAGLRITVFAYRWATKTGVVERLLDLLEKRFGETTALSASQLEIWSSDDDFIIAVYLYKSAELPDEQRDFLKSAVTNLITNGAGDPKPDEADLIEEVISAIEDLLPQALETDDLIRYGIKTVTASVESVNTLPIRLDWVPNRAKFILDELAEKNGTEAFSLEESLGGPDRNHRLAGLVRDPPHWVREGSGLLWEALAVLLEAAGEWDLALTTWAEAAERPGSDRARSFIQASSAALLLGMDEEGVGLLNRAIDADESHPSVLLAQARHADSIEERVELIDRVEPRNDRDAQFKAIEKAAVLIEKADLDEAALALEEARSFGSESKRIAQLEAEMAVLGDHLSWETGRAPDGLSVEGAARTFIELRDQNREVRAFRVSAVFALKAANAFLQAGLYHAASEVVARDQILDEEMDSVDAKVGIAEPLITMGQAERALELLPDEESESNEARVLRAMAQLTTGNEGDAAAALEVLRAELTGDHALPAAGRILLAAATGRLPWDEEAEKLVNERDPQLCAVFKARYLGNQSGWREAERVLAPYTAAAVVKVELLRLSIQEGDRDRIKVRAEDLFEGNEDPGMQLEAAKALLSVGETARATTVFEAIKAREALAPEIRIEAIRELCQIASDGDRNEDALRLTATWLGLDPKNASAGWGRAYSFSRLGRFDEAAEVIDQMELVSTTVGHTQLACRIIHQTDSSLRGLERMIEMVDRLDEDDEELELMLLFSALALTEEISAEVAERVNIEAFLKKFPKTKAIQQIEAPRTADEVKDFIREMTGDRAARIAEASRMVFDKGEAPSAILAAVSGNSVSKLWRQLLRRPTSYGESALDELERADADYALGTGAVWDSSSVAVSAMLGGDHASALVISISVSVLAQATIDDLTEDLARLDAGKETMSVGTDDEDEPWVQITSPEDNDLDAARAEGMRSVSRQISVEPDAPAEDTSDDAGFLRGDKGDVALQLKAAIAPLVVARRRGLPVFSDDRHTRVQARRMGLRSFGTQHIIDALHARGDINDERKADLRKSLHGLGTIGIRPTSQELIERCAEANYSLSENLALTIWDPLLLRGGDGSGLVSLVDMLCTIHENSPDDLNWWVMRVIDLIAKQIQELSIAQAGSHLIVAGFSHTLRRERDGAFLSALTSSTSWAVSRLGLWGEGPVKPDEAGAMGGVVLTELLDRHEHPLIVGAMVGRFVALLDLGIRHKCRKALIPLYVQIVQAAAAIERSRKADRAD